MQRASAQLYSLVYCRFVSIEHFLLRRCCFSLYCYVHSALLEIHQTVFVGQQSIVHAARRSMHALLWAAGGKGKARFVPLDKAMSPEAVAKEAQTWQPRVHVAQVAYQSEVSGLLEVLQGSSNKPGLCSSQCEAASAAVLCAMAFEVLAAVCELLPQGGWDRAVRLFSHVMVRLQ